MGRDGHWPFGGVFNQKRDTFRGGEVEPWIRGIARYEHLNHLRKQGQIHRLKARALQEAPPVTQAALPPQKDVDLFQCLEALKPQDRMIVDLFYGRVPPEDGPAAELHLTDQELEVPKTDREIAERLSGSLKSAWSTDRVRTRRHRALRQLRECMKKRRPGGQDDG